VSLYYAKINSEFEPTLEGYLARVHPEDRMRTREAIQHAFVERTPFEFEERIICVRTDRSDGFEVKANGFLMRPALL
jgi:hypothetical protein